MPNQPSKTKRAATFRLDRALIDRAIAQAKANGESVTDVVAAALEEYAPEVMPPPAPPAS